MSALSPGDQAAASPESPLHIRTAFEFSVRAPYKFAFTLFGPNGERSWAGKDWNPEFLYPRPSADVPGAVFTVKHGPHQAIWVNTAFDIKARHIQYSYFIPEVMVTTIDLTFFPLDSGSTKVRVIYERSALDAAVNHDVQELGVNDRARGADWEKAIDAYLEQKR